MHKHLWPLKVIAVLLRNQLWLKPRACRAKRLVERLLYDAGYFPKSTALDLGLSEASGLCLTVIFRTDNILRDFDSTPLKYSLLHSFRKELSASGYPAEAIPLVSVTFHSYEEIIRSGGYGAYFN
jgi:hypothetical protein